MTSAQARPRPEAAHHNPTDAAPPCDASCRLARRKRRAAAQFLCAREPRRNFPMAVQLGFPDKYYICARYGTADLQALRAVAVGKIPGCSRAADQLMPESK